MVVSILNAKSDRALKLSLLKKTHLLPDQKKQMGKVLRTSE